MKIAIIIVLVATAALHAQVDHNTVMQDGPLDLAAPTVFDDYFFNFRLGGDVFIQNLAQWSWAGISEDLSIIQSNQPSWGLITPTATGTVYIGGRLQVGLPGGFGLGDLNVRGNITEKGHSVMRWRGAATSDPSSPEEGDMYFRTSDNKVRIYSNSAWRDLN